MKAVSFYHRETGILSSLQVLASDDEAVALNTPKDHIAIDGHHHHLQKRVDLASGLVVDYQPPAPSDDHEWNNDTKAWQLTAEAGQKVLRRHLAIVRIDELHRRQHDLVRKHVLGDVSALEQLRSIDDEIAALHKDLA